MSVSFVKLFNTITDSSVWALPDGVRVIWITLLSMANSRGNVHASIVGIANRARKTVPEVEDALRIFMAPDPYSRTKALEGRRLVEIDGGWQLVNYEKHRRALNAEAVRESKRVYAENQRKLNDSSTEVEKSRSESIACSSSLSRSGSDLDPDLTRARETQPTPAQGQPHVYYTLDGWTLSPELRAEAVIAGVPPAAIDQRVNELKNGPIGGKRGVIDRDDYVRAQFGKWKTWAETDRAKALSGAAKGPGSSFATPGVRGGVLVLEASDKHRRFAARHGLDLDAIMQRLAFEQVVDKVGLGRAREMIGERLSAAARDKAKGAA